MQYLPYTHPDSRNYEMNQLCKVCGEPAAGFHFGAFTCEGCKSFFGRTCNNPNGISDCKNGGRCEINKKNRTSCKPCRLKKCLSVGMSKSGSRYGRRSNWFKIHCLLTSQNQNESISPISNPESNNNISRTPTASPSILHHKDPPKKGNKSPITSSSNIANNTTFPFFSSLQSDLTPNFPQQIFSSHNISQSLANPKLTEYFHSVGLTALQDAENNTNADKNDKNSHIENKSQRSSASSDDNHVSTTSPHGFIAPPFKPSDLLPFMKDHLKSNYFNPMQLWSSMLAAAPLQLNPYGLTFQSAFSSAVFPAHIAATTSANLIPEAKETRLERFSSPLASPPEKASPTSFQSGSDSSDNENDTENSNSNAKVFPSLKLIETQETDDDNNNPLCLSTRSRNTPDDCSHASNLTFSPPLSAHNNSEESWNLGCFNLCKSPTQEVPIDLSSKCTNKNSLMSDDNNQRKRRKVDVNIE